MYVFIAFSVTNAVALPSVKLVSFDISFTSYPFKLNEPVVETLPVNWCVSSRVSPNFVEPLANIIDAEVNVVCYSFAVIVP